jgi:plasmid replication initiation protein
MNKDNAVAKIENAFIFNAQYKMSSKEQKIFYHLVTKLNPKTEKEFHVISVPIKEIETLMRNDNSSRYGSFFEDLERVSDSLMSKMIKFPTNVLLNGKKLKDRINLFSSIRVASEEDDEPVLIFSFSPDMSPFLLELHQYVNLDVQEIVTMSNAHSIRMYSIFKSEKNRLKGIKKEITMQYFLEELKLLLGIEDKYNHQLIDLKTNVLDKIRDEINENVPSMSVDYNYIKTARKVTGVAFTVADKKAKQLETSKPKKEIKPKAAIKAYIPSEKELDALTKAKLRGYNILLEFGIFEGIAYKQILPKIKGTEFDGYEDFFIEKAIQHFEKTAIQTTTKELKASTFVTWWTKNKIFEGGDVWADTLEKLVKHKKQLLVKDPEAYENRVIARAMTNTQFNEYIKNRNR